MTIALINNLENLGETLTKEFTQIAGMDKTSSLPNVADEILNFQEQLDKVGEEIAMENSLDLTFERDLENIIKNLKQNISDNDEEIANDADNTNVSAMFEQILTLQNMEFVSDGEFNPDNIVDLTTPQNVDYISSEEEKLIGKSELKLQDIEDNSAKSLSSSMDEEMLEDLNIESISTDLEDSAQENYNQDSSMQEHGIKVMIAPKVDSANLEIETEFVSKKSAGNASEITPEKIIEQITKQTEALSRGSRVNIVLNPENLGKVNIQLINAKEGLSAVLTVTTNEARDLLLKGLDGLKETLTAQGVGVDNVLVKISESQESEYNPDWTEQEDSRGGAKEQGEQRREKEKGLFEKTMAKMNDEENGNV